MYYINMHVHSLASDGTQSPEEIVRVAYYCGMKAVVLTEHDVIDSIDRVRAEASIYKLETMTGVELGGRLNDGTSYDILAYDFNPSHEGLLRHIERVTAARNEHTKRVFDSAVKQGKLQYDWDSVLRNNPCSKWFCNNQVFDAMMADGIYGVHDYDAFHDCYMSGNKEAGEMTYRPSAEDILRLIAEAGGISVLAHPKGHSRHSVFNERHILELIEMGLMGIECVYPTHSNEDIAYLTGLAQRHKLYVTGGTDLHGLYDNYYVPFHSYGATKEQYEAIKNRR